MNRNYKILMGLLAAIVLLASCSGGATPQPEPAPARDFSMRVLPESFAMQGSGSFRLVVSELEDGAVLEVQARDSADLSHLYIEVEYDSSAWTPVSGEPGPLMADAPLSLLAGSGGRVQYGQLYAGTDPQGAGGSGMIARLHFQRGPEQAGRSISAAPKSSPTVDRNPLWDIITWNYVNAGDYDQNGEVNIADLTPLGVNLNTSGPFEADSALFMVDGDGNGEINLSDITPIGVNFGNSVDGYELYASPDGADHPADPQDDNGSGARSVASLAFADAEGGGAERKHFRYTDGSVELHDRYWVRAQAGTDSSPAGGLSNEWQKDWWRNVIHTQDKQASGSAPDLTMIDGYPAVVFTTGLFQDSITMYSRAENRIGTQWSTPVKISGEELQNSHPLMIDRNGVPAVVFRDAEDNLCYYRHAMDAEGSQWTGLKPLVAGEYIPKDLYMFQGEVMMTATDGNQSAGFVINEAGDFVQGYSLGLGADLASIPRSGGIDILYRSSEADNTIYAEMEFNGLTFEFVQSTIITGDLNLDGTPLLFDFGGQLNMMLQDDLAFDYRLVQGQKGGDIFTAPNLFIDGPVDGIDAAESMGRMWMAYHHYLDQEVQCMYSAEGDLGETTMITPLDSEFTFLFRVAIADVSGHPAVLYFDGEGQGPFELILARYI